MYRPGTKTKKKANRRGPGCDGQNAAVYNCEILDMVRYEKGFVVRKLFKIKKEPQYINL
jgi:hypothetical protein